MNQHSKSHCTSFIPKIMHLFWGLPSKATKLSLPVSDINLPTLLSLYTVLNLFTDWQINYYYRLISSPSCRISGLIRSNTNASDAHPKTHLSSRKNTMLHWPSNHFACLLPFTPCPPIWCSHSKHLSCLLFF